MPDDRIHIEARDGAVHLEVETRGVRVAVELKRDDATRLAYALLAAARRARSDGDGAR